ncbi:MAG: acyltransferase [Bacteroidota bacterium]
MQILNKIQRLFFVKPRLWKYNFLSDCKNVSGKPDLYLPLLLKGKGEIKFGSNVQNGVLLAQNTYSSYNYILAREKESKVLIGNNVVLANGASIQAVSKISIGNNVMIGINCFLVDTDGHDLHPDKRMDGDVKTENIVIEDNVVVFYNSVVLKGVTIGKNSIIGSCSVVTKSIPPNVFAAGNPAKVIRSL